MKASNVYIQRKMPFFITGFSFCYRFLVCLIYGILARLQGATIFLAKIAYS